MRISDLIERKGRFVATIAPGESVQSVLGELARHNVGALVVSADAATVDGIVSERDVVRALDELGPGVLGRDVATIMSRTVQTCAPDDPVDSLMATMTGHRIRHVPVVDRGALVGIVSIGDVVKERLEELERDRDALVSYINAR